MSKKTHKILVASSVFITILIGAVMVILINPTNNPKVTETKEKLFLFGQPTPPDDTTTIEPTSTGDGQDSDIPTPTTQKLMRLVDGPVAGAVAITKGKETVIRYTEQKTGDIYDHSLNNKTSERIFQQTLLGIHDALWNKNGENMVLRFLKTESDQDIIKTYTVSFGATSTDPSGRFLPDNLLEVVLSPDGKNVVYLQKDNENAFVLLENWSGEKEREQVFTSSFTEWLMEYPKEELFALTTKPSYDIDGYLYFINTGEGTMEKILGEIKGLTTLVNPDATKVLYAKSGKNSHSLAIYNVTTKTETILGLKTFPEKCIWGDGENSNLLYCAVSDFGDNINLPDDWYKGKVSFSDDIWLINTETGKSGPVIKTGQFIKEKIDVIKPFLSPDNKHLLFINKKDGSLWMLKLETIGPE